MPEKNKAPTGKAKRVAGSRKAPVKAAEATIKSSGQSPEQMS